MKKLALAAVLALAWSAASAADSVGVMSGALIEALAAIEKPELGGVFAYVGETNAPRAFADMLARDAESMKKYAGKLKADLKVAGGATAWDHEVCANLVTFFAGGITGVKRPKEKIVKLINEALLSPVKTLQDIAAARK